MIAKIFKNEEKRASFSKLRASIFMGSLFLGSSCFAEGRLENGACSGEYRFPPSSSCHYDSCCSFTGNIDYLYWKPVWSQYNYANKLLLEDDAFRYDPKKAKYDWDSGFRVGIGTEFPCKQWKLSLSWTHYRTDGEDTDEAYSSSPEGTALILQGTPYFFTDFLFSNAFQYSLESNWNLHLNILDLECSKSVCFGSSLSLEPVIGLRFIQTKNAIYASLDNSDARFTTTVSNKNTFQGVGGIFGLRAIYSLFCGLGLYGESLWSLAYGSSETHYTADSSSKISFASPAYDIPFEQNTVKYQNQMKIGIVYQTKVNCDQNQIQVRLGWEQHSLYRFSSFIIPFVDPQLILAQPGALKQSNLVLQGITISAQVGF